MKDVAIEAAQPLVWGVGGELAGGEALEYEVSHAYYYHIWTYHPRFYSLALRGEEGGGRAHLVLIIAHMSIYGNNHYTGR